VFATFASLTLRLPVYDTQCGAKLFRRTDALRRALDRPFRSRWIFDVELIDRLLQGGPGVAPLSPRDLEELPLRSWRDVSGSKFRWWQMVWGGAEVLGLWIGSRIRPRRARSGAGEYVSPP
jgi:dolichyl-phosphate beta-glucosyltransferase